VTTRPRAVVTGGAGFLGSYLCERLLADGYEVTCLDNFVTGTPANVAHLAEVGPFRLVRYDVTEHIYVAGEIDLVLHFASPASPVDYLRLPIHTLKVGAIGTLHTLGLAREKGARFVLASTSEAYGDPQVHPQPETYWGNVNPVGPRGVYDEAKRYAEAMTMAYHRQQGVDTCVARIFNVYGTRMRRNDGRAVPTFMRQALEHKPLTVFGDGSQTRSFCYVDDMIRGLYLLAQSAEHHPVNIGNPNEFTILELAETVIRVTDSKSEIVYEALPVDDPQIRQPDITRAKEILGWAPEVELEEGLRRMLPSLGREPLSV
jgi:dTDP-glucose 4,6-dehydratase